MIEEARAKEKDGDIESAEEAYDDAIDALKHTKASKRLLSAGYFARGRHWIRRKQDTTAVRDFTRALKHVDKNNTGDRAELYFYRGTCRHRLQQLKAALLDLDKAIQLIEDMGAGTEADLSVSTLASTWC